MSYSSQRKKGNGRCVIATVLAVVVLGRYVKCEEIEDTVTPEGVYLKGVPETLMADENKHVIQQLMDNVDADNIRNYLRNFTSRPHIAGKERNKELADFLADHWRSSGIDHVTLTPYNVMLSYPDMNDLNYVQLLDDNDVVQYKSPLREDVLRPGENDSDIVPPFNAYSGSGDVSGELVYVNYGRLEDHLHLEANTTLTVSGKIALVRYGKIFRGDKVRLAEARGAIGVILFSDPDDVTNGDISQVYPHDWYLPPSGTQRGTVYIGNGDPLTPGYPAIETAYRQLSEDQFLPSIPVHPIGYGIAISLMRELAGDEVPISWRGGMNVTYRYGGNFHTAGWKANIHVSTHNENVTIYNAIGIIRGEIEPDRYVILGNHRDAWVFGAQDPSSGTAVMMEVSRVLGHMVKSGVWRPRRSIMFCSWGAEEYGLIGSTEWVEHYSKTLGERAVAYINLDLAVVGNYSFFADSTPSLHEAVLSATKKVANPNETETAAGRTTVYDTWRQTFPSSRDDSRPGIPIPGSGSDHAPFRDRLGIPVLNMCYIPDPRMPVSFYPMYHSAYETFYLVDEIMDKGFKRHEAIGRVLIEVARHLADSLIIPFNVADYSTALQDITDTFLENFKDSMESHNLDTGYLTEAVQNFTTEAQHFKERIANANLNNPFIVRGINDQLMKLNRAFLDPAGLPGRKLKRHILFAESIVNTYSGSSFPGLTDALTEIRQGHDVDNQWKIVQLHYSVILYTIQSAASTLRDVTNFMYDY